MQITAKVIQDSINDDNRLTTLELEYPRFIHGELMTHRTFSRNAASSRAIPIEKMIEQVTNNPAMPVHWGANKTGMQADEEVSYILCGVDKGIERAKFEWDIAARSAVRSAINLNNIGLHKQIVNRVLEPFQMMKTIISATEFDNFFSLRCHKDAQPEIQVLANVMKSAMETSVDEGCVLPLSMDEWHVPYVRRVVHHNVNGRIVMKYFLIGTNTQLTLLEALKVSASCCAQVSYRVLDDSLIKAINIYGKLVDSKPVHASPFEHQATPDCNDSYQSNFKGWAQHRSMIGN